MRTTRIDLRGDASDGHYATITRPGNGDEIVVKVFTPESPRGIFRNVSANIEADGGEAIFKMAEYLQEKLDGVRGTNSMIHDYLRELQRFAD